MTIALKFTHGDKVIVDAPTLMEFEDLAPYHGQTGVVFMIEPGRLKYSPQIYGVRFADGKVYMFTEDQLQAVPS